MAQRADASLRAQVAVYLATPLLTIHTFFVLRLLRLYATATCMKTGWDTRQQVESLTTSPT
jgi:hyaluronan synthase